MIILVGLTIVVLSVMGGFFLEGGYYRTLMQWGEFVIIAGAALGAMIVMSPRKVLFDMVANSVAALKGNPYGRSTYEQLFQMLYELFLTGRRNGMVALEEHILSPQTSSILTKYPSFLNQRQAVEFLCGGLRPIIDGRIKADQLKVLFETELEQMENELHAPVNVLGRVADALPGFGIVAAVLGIVITMASISGPIETIGEKVAAALVGTFLGVFLSYGVVGPMSVNLEFIAGSQIAYFSCIANCVTSFANGMAPIMAVEIGRRGISSDVRPTAEALELMLKSLAGPGKK